MKYIEMDIETFSSVDLSKSGVYRYAESDDFEVLLFGYSVDGGDVQVVDLAQGEKIPQSILDALTDNRVKKYAYNAAFERICLSRYLGYPAGEYINPDSWYCIMVWAATLGLPFSLEKVGEVLGIEKQKHSEGKELIKMFCVPCEPSLVNGMKTRLLPAYAQTKWELFKEYNKRDVEAEMQIKQKLCAFPVKDSEWDNYHLDQCINDLGIALDMDFVDSALVCDETNSAIAEEKARDMTGIDNPNSPAQLKAWLAEQGQMVDSLSKSEVARLLKDATGNVEEILKLRQELAKSSVKKYTAMKNCVCSDGRARGLIQFYGANRTGRYSSKIIQLQNLPQNHLQDLKGARESVKTADYAAINDKYGNVSGVLSELIRTAFVPKAGCRFIVSDFSAIEARVIAWFAGEEWRNRLFADGGDIYCMSASQMFKVPVEKNGINGHLRQKGKIAELACIAEDQLVLTDQGLIPIQSVTTDMKLWDGEEWVAHDGVIFKEIKEVITYDGLTATADHLVWVEGQSRPIQFGIAAASGACLVKTADGGNAVRLGENYSTRETLEQNVEPLLCSDAVPRLWTNSMARPKQSIQRGKQGVSELQSAEGCSRMVEQAFDGGKIAVREPDGQRIQKLWRKRHKVRVHKCERSGALSAGTVWRTRAGNGNRSHKHKWELCEGKPAICAASDELCESTQKCVVGVRSEVLALCKVGCDQKTFSRQNERGSYPRCGTGSYRETQELERYPRTARVYDIRNAGRNNRFTVSGRLVHNCGYGGSVGALKAMGATAMGIKESELKPLVTAWRQANPNITKFWWAVDRATKYVVSHRCAYECYGLAFSYEKGVLFIRLPSGRRLAYIKPRIGINNFGSECVTYEGLGTGKKWERIESYGPKFVENCLAAGTLVLTDRGLVKIEDIKADDRIWDGEEWVSHDGLIYQGIKDTVIVGTLHMTADHKILTTTGWIQCGKAQGLKWAQDKTEDEISVRPSGLKERVYDIRNCGPRHRFAVSDNGKLRIVSNCVQATARDILAEAMQRLWKCGYRIVMHVHDEVVLEVPNGQSSVAEVSAIMSETPSWAQGLKLNADGYECEFYKKE